MQLVLGGAVRLFAAARPLPASIAVRRTTPGSRLNRTRRLPDAVGALPRADAGSTPFCAVASGEAAEDLLRAAAGVDTR